jgi:hypothetical protein
MSSRFARGGSELMNLSCASGSIIAFDPLLERQHVAVHLEFVEGQLGDLLLEAGDLVALLGDLALEGVDLGHITLLMKVAATCGTMALP